MVIQVPRELDRAAYVLLSAAAQCGNEALERTAATLASHQADPRPALDILKNALGSRPLLVEDLDAPGGAAPDAELRELFAPSLKHVDDWMQRHASVVVVQGDVEGAVRPSLAGPRPGQGWDAALLWAHAHRDVERYTLAVARARLLGEGAVEDSFGRDAASIAGDLWRAMNQELRDLVALLAVHGRPVERALFERLGLVSIAVIDMGIDAVIVEQSSRGMLRVATPSVWSELVSRADLRERHRRLGEAFAKVARNEHADGVTPLAVLEAHRHYAAVPDVERAEEFARFGVQLLLSTARRQSIEGRDIPGSHARSARTYEVVMKLDEQIRAGGSEGIGSRAQAYAIHYRAYNRYKAKEDPATETLAAYREALAVWPQNALFWSRTIGCCFVADRYAEGVRARDEAFDKVPMHPQRAAYLVARTVEHLLRRDMPLAALLVWGDHRTGAPLLEQRAERQLFDRLARGWDETRLWARGLEPILLRKPVRVEILVQNPSDPPTIRCKLLERESCGSYPEMAFRMAVQDLVDEITSLVEDPAANHGPAARRRELVDYLDLEALSRAQESLRWLGYLASLDARTEAGEITAPQRRTLLSTWRRARQLFPRLRRPSLGLTDEGQLHVSFTFADRPEASFTIDIDPDGRVDWFYRNVADGRVCGTEEVPESELAEETLRLLAPFES